MMQEYITIEGENLSEICYHYYGTVNESILAQVLDANQNIGDLGLIFPQGTRIILPELPNPDEIAPVALWS